MTWVAVGAAAVSAVAGYAQSRKAAKDKKNDKKDAQEMTQEEAALARQNSAFDKEQDYYYGQLEKQERSRGLDEFRKFSTVTNFAPDYVNTNPGPVLPAKPDSNASADGTADAAGGDPFVDMNANANDGATNQSSGG